jgi:hypothetical protein
MLPVSSASQICPSLLPSVRILNDADLCGLLAPEDTGVCERFSNGSVGSVWGRKMNQKVIENSDKRWRFEAWDGKLKYLVVAWIGLKRIPL